MDKNDPQRPPTDEELEDVKSNWEEEGKQFDPNRGDHVDLLNDTTPPPPPQRHDFPPTERRKKKHRWPIYLLILLMLGGGAYFVIKHPKAAAPSVPKTITQTTTPTPVESTTITPKHYDSQNFSLGLDYPETWKLSDTATKLTLVSPAQPLTDISGKQVQGHSIVTIQPKQASLPDFKTGAATAVIESPKVTYKNPTSNQRAQTYISLLSYATDTSSGLDAIYITGDNGYTIGQSVPQTDAIQTDPLVTVTFATCTTDDCATNPAPISLKPGDWKAESLSKPILTILQSLALD